MEVTALKQSAVPAGPAPGPLLRLASDERLITLVRRGHHAAFEALVQRYQSRLLAFCRHMLGSREDAEDVLQEVFAAAFNAILADERDINVRPWLYRIARNRSLNHLRRATAVGMDSMDTYFADHGQSVPERILQRESFHALVEDIGKLAETQRTALLLREMDALSYEQIAEVMETTVPSVKSLLVRARVALAEAAEARQLSCEEVRLELAEVAEGLVKISPPVRRHVRDCQRCHAFNKQLKHNERALAALAPVGGIVALMHKLIATKLGSTTGGAYAAGGGGATAGGVAAGAGAASSLGGVGGLAGLGSGAVAAKAVAGLAAAALLTAGAVEVGPGHTRSNASHKAAAGESGQTQSAYAPTVVSSTPQAVTISRVSDFARTAGKQHKNAVAAHHKHTAKAASTTASSATTPTSGLATGTAGADAVHSSKARTSSTPETTQVVEVTTSTTALPSQAATPPAPVVTAPDVPSPSAPPTSEDGPTGPSGPAGPTGGAAPPATEAEAPPAAGAPTEAETGGSQAPSSAGETSPAG